MNHTHTYNANNIFRKIIDRKIPADILKEDKNFLAFRDANPQAQHHILCIPKCDVVNFNDFTEQPDETIVNMMRFVRSVAAELNLKSYRLVMNCGEGAGQSVMHFHIHILADEDAGLVNRFG